LTRYHEALARGAGVVARAVPSAIRILSMSRDGLRPSSRSINRVQRS
jgi:hypothetical protein